MAVTKETIKAGSIARVTDKASGKFLGFLVKSNSNENYYQITCLKIANECVFFCNCYAGTHGTECCHVKAVKELVEARHELDKQQAQKPAPTIIPPAQSAQSVVSLIEQAIQEACEEVKHEQDRKKFDRNKTALTRNSGFQLMA